MLKSLRKKKFVRFFGISLTGTVVTVGFAMLNSILTARILGPENKGLYTLLYSTILMSIATTSLKLGLSQAYHRKEHSLDELTSNSIVLTLLSAILSVVLCAIAIFLLQGKLFKDVPLFLLLVVLLTIPIKLFAINMRSMLDADYDIPRSTIVESSTNFFFFIAFATLALFNLANLETAVMCILFSISGMAILSIVMLYRRGYSGFRLNRPLLKPMVAFSLKSHVGGLFKYLQYRFDIFLVAYFLSPREVGIYGIAMVIGEMLWRIPRVANTILLPRLRGESDRRSAELTARLNRIIFAFTLLCMLPLALFVDFIVELLYGNEYIEAGGAVLALLPGVLALSVFKLLVPNLIMRGRVWTFSFSVACSVVVMVLLDLFMIPAYGIIGAGIASSIGYTTASLIVLITVVKINDLPLLAYFDFTEELRIYLRSRKKNETGSAH